MTFNALEIFEIAEQIERNGVKFYRKAAAAVTDSKIHNILLDLAAMEAEHEEIFADMRKQISTKQRELVTFDPENEAALYLQAVADGHVFDLKKDPAEQLSGKESVSDILKTAIEAEKDSIVFYLGIKNFVSAGAVKEKIEDIISEEQSHIVTLSQKLADLK
jgi:rubrerythrin